MTLDKIVLKIKLSETAKEFSLPSYATAGSAGIDLRADIKESLLLKPKDRCLVPTGIFMQLPENYEGQIRSRSGLAINHGVVVLNSPGTIDSDYRGEIKVILINHSNDEYNINRGDKIAQMIISKYVNILISEEEDLSQTKRAAGGFGSSGYN